MGAQDADAAVALNLFFSRVTEQKQPCSEALSALAGALPGALAALQAYEAVHSVADLTASTARAAHQQVLQAQVRIVALLHILYSSTCGPGKHVRTAGEHANCLITHRELLRLANSPVE